MFAPVTDGLIERAGIGDGLSALDVAAGTGEPSLTIAEAIGAKGTVICTDAVLEMMAAARRAATARGRTRIEFCQCLADSLPFAHDSFDAVVCRLGAMFFPDPVAALREMMRVVKPRGRVSLAVWGSPESNPFFSIVTRVLARYIEPAPDDGDAPGAFRFAEAGKLARLLVEAGGVHINELRLSFRIKSRLSLAEFWEVRSEMSDTLRQKLAMLDPEQTIHLSAEIKEAVREFFPEGCMSFPAQVLIVTAERSR
ncbi:MAG TPA: class I SAM-dependent methyltransferase [Blastocatellia bacterium]|jgi:SAM-dependent methyltransferase